MAKVKKQNEQKQKPIEGLDRVFHEKARLNILTAIISTQEGVNFKELKDRCDLTDGNLNRHLKVLTDAKVLKVHKTGRGRSTNSIYFLTDFGRGAFEDYLDALEAVVKTAQGAAKRTSA
ncbi:MAG: transcriptional regulator, partial [Planctomycetota bacterium]